MIFWNVWIYNYVRGFPAWCERQVFGVGKLDGQTGVGAGVAFACVSLWVWESVFWGLSLL